MIRRVAWIFVALLLATSTAPAQRETPPEGGPPKPFTLPARTTLVLENGIQLTLVPYGTIPKVTMIVVVRAGHINEAPDEVWLADLTGDYLKEGTATRSAEVLARDASSIGGTISVSVGDDRTFITGDALGEFAPRLVELLADVVRNPKFPDSELSRLKNNMLRRLSVDKADPQTLALERFRQILYGNHPYGRTLPKESMIEGFTVKKVSQFHEANFSGAKTHIYVAGVFDAHPVEEALRKAFGDWPRGGEPVMNVPAPVSRHMVSLIDRPGASQSTLYLGLPVIDPTSHDWIPLEVTNTLLGGAFTSRITANIREDKGYTYSPYSSISSRLHDAYWLQVADVSTAVTGASLKEIFYEINRLRDDAPTKEEVKGIENYDAGIFVLRNSSPRMIISLLAFLDLHGLPDSYLRDYIRNVMAVTPEEVQSMARKYLDPAKMTIVVAGDVKKIRNQVEPYGPVLTAK